MTNNFFTCHNCGQTKTEPTTGGTGYALDADRNCICYQCCAGRDAADLAALKPGEKFYLYLDTKDKSLTNWPGSFKIKLRYIKTGRHNMAGRRFDTWFTYSGGNYHAVQYGDNSQIAHITKLKN